jgi:hypothetical protein
VITVLENKKEELCSFHIASSLTYLMKQANIGKRITSACCKMQFCISSFSQFSLRIFLDYSIAGVGS